MLVRVEQGPWASVALTDLIRFLAGTVLCVHVQGPSQPL